MPEVFVSYARKDKALAEELVAFLGEAGIDCWWDHDLVGGTSYRERIRAEIDAARAGIVIWSKDAARSDFVIDEADLCRQQGKLVSTLAPDFRSDAVPLGFRNAHHTPLASGADVVAALREKGVGGREIGAYALRAFDARIAGLGSSVATAARWPWALSGGVLGAAILYAAMQLLAPRQQADPMSAVDGIVYVGSDGLEALLMGVAQQGPRQIIVRRIETAFLDDRHQLLDTHALPKEFVLTSHGYNFSIPLDPPRAAAIRARGFVAVCWDLAFDRTSAPRRKGRLFAVRDIKTDRLASATFEPADIDTTQRIAAALKCELSS